MKIVNKTKKFLGTFFETVKKVSNGKWDFFAVTIDLAYSQLRFGINFDEYQKYEFYNYSNRYRRRFLLDKHRRLYRRVNTRSFTSSKFIFYKRIADLYEREMILVPHCGEQTFIDFAKKHKRVIIKPDKGSLGKGIGLFVYTDDESAKKRFAKFSKDVPHVCEEYIRQHLDMRALSPASVNTIRIVSLLKGNEVEIVSATLRTGAAVNSVVDNMCSGGVGAQVDISAGVVSTYGIDYSGNRYLHHPISGLQIIGFRIPNWQQALDRVKVAHQRLPQCKLFGWDIAITPNGVDIVEANNRPGSRIMQAMDKTPKGHKIFPYLKKDLLKQKKVKKDYYVPDYTPYIDYEKGKELNAE